MTGQQPSEVAELLWITDAMLLYQHNRDWFQERIDDGRLTKVSLPGSTKVYLRQSELKALGEEPTFFRERFICKAGSCDELGFHCGMCGNYSCETHGHKVVSRGDTIPGIGGGASTDEVVFESWLCNDCAQSIMDAFKQYPPKPVRLGW